jgi:hypothetical protein
MIERLERAIFEAIQEHDGIICSGRGTWEAVPHDFRNGVLQTIARAVLTEMRNPTDAMLGAEHSTRIDGASSLPPYSAKAVWQSMIDAILNGEK